MSTTKKRKPVKMDRKLVAATQPYEVNDVRVLFYKMDGDKIVHPTKQEVINLTKIFNNSRKKIYQSLRESGYTQLRKK